MKHNTAKQSLYNIYGKLLNLLPSRWAISLEYRRVMGYFPNLRSPETLNEKIQWIKLHGNREEMTYLTDKLLLKRHITRTLGEEYILPAIWEGESLPKERPKEWLTPYVLKANHGCMMNYFVENEGSEDWEKMKNLSKSWMGTNFRPHLQEPQYKNIKKKLFIERRLADPTDYKFYCLHGKVELIVIVKDRAIKKKEFILDKDWNILSPQNKNKIEIPCISKEAIRIAESLSQDINFVRIDMFIENNKPIIGEFSFTPAAGYDRDLKSLDMSLGKKLKLFLI
jgi:hypothetical protein